MTAALSQTARSCPVCGAAGREAFEKQPYRYLRCLRCTSLWLEPMPTEAALAEYYSSGAFYGGAQLREGSMRKVAELRLRKLERLTPGRRLLDVGCASGTFLDVARSRGWLAMGLEPSASLAALARERGLEVFDGASPDALPARTFDVVTAWEVVEHVRDPGRFLDTLCSIVAAGGILALSTPSADGLPSRLLGARFPFALAPEHLVLIARSAARSLLESRRLSIVELKTFSGMDVESARSMLSKRFGSWAVVAGPAVAAVFWLLDVIGNGTEFEVFARKKP
jgi:2-polyprenyl-3-methyl-5-hydroxy-6-metoxy-1,4-benzoquinol methylase